MEYLIKFSVSFIVLFLGYKLLLSHTSIHRFKRFFLLLIPVISAIIPLMIVRTVTIESQASPAVFYEQTIDSPTAISLPVDETAQIQASEIIEINWWTVVAAIYLIVVLVFLTRMSINLIKLRTQGKPAERYRDYEIVQTDKIVAPHSFWNRIYVGKDFAFAKAENEIVLDHELAHLRQRHSLDLIYANLIVAVFWFNPFVYFWKRAIINNHEYLADAAVLSKGIDYSNYRSVLLKFLNPPSQVGIANAINLADFKTRIKMMNKHTRPLSILIRTVSLLLVTGLLIAACGKTKKEVVIDHSIGMTAEMDANMVYGIDFDPYVKTGTLEYNYVQYKYEVQDDYSIKMWTLEGDPVDIEKNKLFPMAKWDFSRETQSLKDEPLTEKRISNGTLKLLKTNMSNYRENISVSLDEFVSINENDYESVSLTKRFEDDAEIFQVMLFEKRENDTVNNRLDIGVPLLFVFNGRYSNEGIYFIEDKKVDYQTMLAEVKSRRDLGYKVDTLFIDGPAFFAGKELSKDAVDLQPVYQAMFKNANMSASTSYSYTQVNYHDVKNDTLTTVIDYKRVYKSTDPIIISSVARQGEVIIDDLSYSYTKDDAGIQFYNDKGEEVSWYEKGWDVREQLMQTNPSKTFGQIQNPDNEYYINDRKVTQAEFLNHGNDIYDLSVTSNAKGGKVYKLSDKKPTLFIGVDPLSTPLTEKQMQEYCVLEEFYRDYPAQDFIVMVNGKYRMVDLYKHMSREQKKSVKKYVKSTSSIQYFIDDNGNYYRSDSTQTTAAEIKSVLNQLSPEQKDNASVFSSMKSFKAYKKRSNKSLHPTQMIYISVYAKDPDWSEDKSAEEIKRIEGLNKTSKAKLVQHAGDHPRLKNQTEAFKKLLNEVGIKNTY